MNMMIPTPDLSLAQLLEQVHQRCGIGLKKDIGEISPHLNSLPTGWHPNGDDTAAIPLSASVVPSAAGHDSTAVSPKPSGYQLLAIEGMQGELVQQHPWFAGWCSLMVNCSDIAAMGGYPTAVVNALWCRANPADQSEGRNKAINERDLWLSQLISGMQAASQHLGVPIVGGHSHLRSDHTNLAVAILGYANRLLSAFAAAPGDRIVLAIDHRGAFFPGTLCWNAATESPPSRLRGDLALLPQIAEQGLAHACKDISQAGLLGSLTMLLESARCGADVRLDQVVTPAGVELLDWLCAFPSFGYLLTTPSDCLPQLLETFAARDIHAAEIGEVTKSQVLTIAWRDQQACFYDLNESSLTGFSPSTQLH